MVVFSQTFSSSGPGPSQSYNPPAGVYLGDGVYDPAYDMGLDPIFQNLPHTSSTLTIQWFASGNGWQGGDDEYWAIDNVAVLLTTGNHAPVADDQIVTTGQDTPLTSR